MIYACRVDILDVIKQQFPGRLIDRLGLELHLKTDAYFLQGTLYITNNSQIYISCLLEPLEVSGCIINAKVPEHIVLHLCSLVS